MSKIPEFPDHEHTAGPSHNRNTTDQIKVLQLYTGKEAI